MQISALSRALRINVKVAYLDGRGNDEKVDFVELKNVEEGYNGMKEVVLLYRCVLRISEHFQADVVLDLVTMILWSTGSQMIELIFSFPFFPLIIPLNDVSSRGLVKLNSCGVFPELTRYVTCDIHPQISWQFTHLVLKAI